MTGNIDLRAGDGLPHRRGGYAHRVRARRGQDLRCEQLMRDLRSGIDSQRADEYYAVQDLIKQLDYAANEAARRLVNGESDENAAAQWLQKYAVMDPKRAQQRVKFIKRYRSYVINYNLGENMVRRYIEKRSGPDPEKRWSEFGKLLSTPRLPSGFDSSLPNMSSTAPFPASLMELG